MFSFYISVTLVTVFCGITALVDVWLQKLHYLISDIYDLFLALVKWNIYFTRTFQQSSAKGCNVLWISWQISRESEQLQCLKYTWRCRRRWSWRKDGSVIVKWAINKNACYMELWGINIQCSTGPSSNYYKINAVKKNKIKVQQIAVMFYELGCQKINKTKQKPNPTSIWVMLHTRYLHVSK